ncbi:MULTISPECIES: ferrichrome ABC transporter substrate-binding protein [Corallococcus]|uniref:ferrichrome ABC transporter substrate-binding protein n=1 Tax=Corallococcus TaxID=83461 RepID=UPI00117C59E6|nr:MULTISPECIES: ferrichrome ABC transporter substrate-binding protein [Corallococcus]NBD12311.1 ferrichrome ABC transporter substrate-binding protein [Corallococcus silvisoli]TSC25264.1 ferrichrome ABC transporter substrate-binding protein [Corallococcus sp. Z5C101001]
MSRRSQLFLLVLVSGLLHAALFLALSRSSAGRVRRPSAPRAIEMEIVTRDSPPVSTPPPARPVPKPPRSAPRAPTAPIAQPAPHEAPSRPAPEPMAPDALAESTPSAQRSDALAAASTPRGGDVPSAGPKLDLNPRGLMGGGLLKGGPPSTGRTIRNDPGSQPDPKALAALEAEHVQRRVDGWAKDAAAAARASGGAMPPYFAKLRQGFAERLVDPPPPDARVVLGRLRREQLEAMERFGRTGSPDSTKERDFRMEGFDRMRAAAESGRAANMAMMDVTAPVLALAAIVEVRQARDGRLVDLKVLEGSGDPKFDTWAVSQLRDALASADAPTDGGVGIHEDGMWTRWRLEEYLGNPRVKIHLLAVY